MKPPENELERRRLKRDAFQDGAKFGAETTALFALFVVGLIYFVTVWSS